MKYIISSICVATIAITAMICTGCVFFSKNTIPTIEQMDSTARTIGTAAALVANMTNIDSESRQVVVDIMTHVQTHTLEIGETFTNAWVPIADNYLQSLVDTNKISEIKYKCILTVVQVAFKGLDYLIDSRYPLARQYTDLISVGVTGFCSSFLSKFSTTIFSSTLTESVDEEAFEYLKDFYFQTISQ